MTDAFALWLAISAGALAVLYGALSARWIIISRLETIECKKLLTLSKKVLMPI